MPPSRIDSIRHSHDLAVSTRDFAVKNIEQTIHDFLLTEPDLAIGANRLAFDLSLIAGGRIDSLAVFSVDQFLESVFNLQGDPEDLIPTDISHDTLAQFR